MVITGWILLGALAGLVLGLVFMITITWVGKSSGMRDLPAYWRKNNENQDRQAQALENLVDAIYEQNDVLQKIKEET